MYIAACHIWNRGTVLSNLLSHNWYIVTMSVVAEGTRKRTVHSPLNSPGVTDNAHDGKISSESKSRKGLSSCMILFIVGGVSIIVVMTLSFYWERLAGRNNHMIINNKIQLPPEFDQGAAWFDKRHIHDVFDDIHIPADRTKRKQTSGDAPKKAADKKTPPPSNAKNGKEGPSSKDRDVPPENNKNGNAKVDKPAPAKGTPSDTKTAEKMEKSPPPKMVPPPVASGKDEPAKKSQPSKPVSSNNANSRKKETAPPVSKESPGKDKNEQGPRVPTPKIVTNDAAADKKMLPPSNSKDGKEGPSSKDRNVPSENNKNGNAKVDKPPPAKETPSDTNKAEKMENDPPPKTVPPAASGKDELAKKSQPSKPVSPNSGKKETAPPVAKESSGKGKNAEQGSRVPTPKIVTNDVKDKQNHKSSEKENQGNTETSSTEAKEPPTKEKKKQVLRGPNPKTVTNDTDKTKGKADQKLSKTKEKANSKESVTKDINEGIKADNGKSKIAAKNSREESQEKRNSRNVKPLNAAANKNGANVDPK